MFATALYPKTKSVLIQQVDYQKIHFYKSLTFFADADQDPEVDYLQPVAWEKIKAFFLDLATQQHSQE